MSTETKKIEWWPVGIILAFVLFISGVLFAVFRSYGEETPLVAENYYQQELDYQQQINREITTKQLNKFIAFRYQPDGKVLDLGYPLDTAASKPVSGTVHFYRPSDDKLDFTRDVQPDAQGVQRFTLTDLQRGAWRVRVTWKEGALEFYDETNLTL
jgi:nitrogen fixation protein FixH